MKAILSEEFGLDALELREVDRPVIGDHQVLVRSSSSRRSRRRTSSSCGSFSRAGR
jgi:hypothetical protein